MPTDLQNLLTLLKNDALVTFAPALITFLTNVQAAQADPVKLQLAWVQLQGNVVQAAPGAEAAVIGQLAEVILGQITALAATAKAALPQ